MAAWLHVLLGALVMAVCAVDVPQDIVINANSTCGHVHQVAQEGEFRLFGTGSSPAADCSFTFKADPVQESTCNPGMCYMFDTYGKIRTSQVSLSIEAGATAIVYVNRTRLPQGPICAENKDTLKVILSQDSGYVFKPEDPAYLFRLTVYHHCGRKGQVKNAKFADVVDDAAGYHHDDEFVSNERNHFIFGVVVGVGFSCSFLVVFAIVYCYHRTNPNRGARMSVAAKGMRMSMAAKGARMSTAAKGTRMSVAAISKP